MTGNYGRINSYGRYLQSFYPFVIARMFEVDFWRTFRIARLAFFEANTHRRVLQAH